MDDIPSLTRLVREHPLLDPLADICGEMPVGLVGGVVRDALLGRPHTGDVDVVVEGDAIRVAHVLSERTGADVVAHGRFGTALVTGADGRSIDLVSARRESYPRPGALPVVEPGTIADDLARRDFTINAMMLPLSGPHESTVVDPFDGRSDLTDARIRALHARSFIDDPSRLLRAVRYAARLGFGLAPDTAGAARDAAAALTLANARVLTELHRLLEEDTAADALDRAGDLGVRWIRDDPERMTAFGAVDAAAMRPAAPRVAVPSIRLGLAVRPDERARAALDAEARGVADGVDAADDLLTLLATVPPPAELDAILRRTPSEAQVVAVARGAETIATWWATTRDLHLAVDGGDVIRSGIPSGPRVGEVLGALRAAVIEGRVGTDRDAQLAQIAEWTG